MSGTSGYGAGGYAAGGLGVSNYGIYDLLIAQSSVLKGRLDTLTEQASTGLVSTVFSGIGAASKTALDLRGELASQQAQISGISSADQKLTLNQTLLGQIGSIASTYYAQTQSLNALNPSNVDVVAASARASLQQLAGLLNTQNGDDYIFGGSYAGTLPIPAADTILASPFVTAITGSVQALAVNGSAATIAATLAIASSNAAGVSPFSTGLSQPAAILQPSLPSVEVGSGARVPIGLVASANAGATSYGSSTTGSYIRDLLRSLATLGALSSSQAEAAGFDGLVADTRASLGGAVDAIADEQGILGNTQSRIDGASTLLSSVGLALKGQVSNIQDVDIARVATQLTQTQASLQASYKLISNLNNDSLLQYL